MSELDFTGKLSQIQADLKCKKGQTNAFGNYKYRSCEDILEAVKPLLVKHNMSLILSDSIELIGDRFYVVATAQLWLGKEKVEVLGYAREAEIKKGMDVSQITGAASSYARKYALNGLFAIDDTKDSDHTNKGETNGVEKKALTQDQVTKILNLTAMHNAPIEKLLKIVKATKVEDIQQKDYSRSVKILEDYNRRQNVSS